MSAPDKDVDVPPPRPNAAKRTAIFAVVVGVVLGTFIVLGQQGRPPDMPASEPHRLQINTKGELVGIVGDDGLAEAMLPGVQLDKKATEKRVNTGCTACHGSPGIDPRTHACGTAGKCLPEHHPPKAECIKCHRMPRAAGN